MPVHNGADFLTATLTSLLQEPMDGVEILLLDSSPDDSCEAIVKQFERRLPILYHVRRDVMPWPEKTNVGVDMARAPFVAMLHQDDLWLAGRVEAARRAIDAMGDAAMHVSSAVLIDEHGKRIGCWSPPLQAGLHAGANIIERLLVQNFIAIPTPLIRRSAWLEVGGMDPDLWYTADWDLYLKLARAWPVMVSADAVTAFRLHSKSLTMTGTRNAASLREQLEVVLARYGRHMGRRTSRHAWASIKINCALAAAASGDGRGIIHVVMALTSLRPWEMPRFLKETRLVERLLPRARLWLAGSFS